MILWGFSTPTSWEKMSPEAQEIYTTTFNWDMAISMSDKKKAHKHAMSKLKFTNGKWVPKQV